MRIRYRIIFLSIALQSILIIGFSQEPEKKTEIINFFLDCEDCDFTFVRQELPFISFVRVPQGADVHILVTDSKTGSGGRKYFLNFIGLRGFQDQNYEYPLITDQSDTEDDVRNDLLKIIKAGILQYYSTAGLLNNIDIDISDPENRKIDEVITDRWNKWVYSIESGGELQKEASQNEYSAEIEVSARKITDNWKINIESSYEINRENFFDDGEKITNKQDSRQLDAEFIKSLTDKWSAGFFGNYVSRNFLNTNYNIGAAAGMEYNFFPWIESNRKVFAIRYVAGINSVGYLEETIYEKLNEFLFSESLRVNFDFTQPWGEIRAGVEGRHYFHDFSKSRLVVEAELSVRLSKNFSVFCEVHSELLHDQLYLPKGTASLEDILLRRRKLETTYEISSQLGLRFTFGSIYNNVVNERF
jgi:hypothetical protein